MIKISTFHRKVWLIGKDVKLGKKIITPGKRIPIYECPSQYVGVVLSETDKTFELYVGYDAPHKQAMRNILSLALKLNIQKISLNKLERISDMKYWDKLTNTMNKNLFASESLFL